jgi:S1-C subfamily serine protease
MASERKTRRRYLGGLGAALTAGVAGCSSVFGGGPGANASGDQTTVENPTTTTTENASGVGGNGTEPAGNATEATSPYTRVYRKTIESVVLIRSLTARRGGQGSGFVYRDNYIVTNAHVVSDATEVQVRFTNGEWRSASVVGVDASSDLAVIEVQNPPGYANPLPLVENQPAIGIEVLAIGNPYGLEGSVTSGLVSGVNRLIPAPNGYKIPDAIQTGAPVNPGNSGGPLVNLQGEVVGVISSGGGENLAFAVSAALVKLVIPSLIEDGKYAHAYMGVNLRTVTPAIAEQLGLEDPRGVVVTEVRSDGPATGVLQRGDVILSVGGQRIESRQQFVSYLALEASPGDTVQVTIVRDGERQTVELTLGKRPE